MLGKDIDLFIQEKIQNEASAGKRMEVKCTNVCVRVLWESHEKVQKGNLAFPSSSVLRMLSLNPVDLRNTREKE
jgi:hypothetical protein